MTDLKNNEIPDDAIVYQTEYYTIAVNEDGSGYDIINNQTLVIEGTEKMLPQAILQAENSNSFMVNELWRWIRTSGKQQGEAMDKEDAVYEFQLDDEGTVN